MPEFWQESEQRGRETVAFWKQFLPLMTLGGLMPDQHAADLSRLKSLAQEREDRLADVRLARQRELARFNLIRMLTLAVPKLIAGHFDEDDAIPPSLADLYAVVPRSDELNLKTGATFDSDLAESQRRFVVAPAGEAIVRNEIGVEKFESMIAGYPALQQATSDEEAKLTQARAALRSHHQKVDRLNKRAYKKFCAEASSNAALRESLKTAITREK